jgi:tripartite-type tricarboxylate transporter receptor subunit TctC
VGLALLGAPNARAQNDDVKLYPSRPIHIVAAAAAGGTMDVVARLIGQKLSESLGQPVIIDNRPGASTIVGSEYVAPSWGCSPSSS